MSKILDAVSVVLVCKDEVFSIKRQLFLRNFPGYWAFPGGKVDPSDQSFLTNEPLLKNFKSHLVGALVRETKEELGIDLLELIQKKQVLDVSYLGLAVTPDFNPYRFATSFFKITLTEKIPFVVDQNEAEIAQWYQASELLSRHRQGKILAVPPVLKVMERLGQDIHVKSIPDLNFEMTPDEVPWIEAVKGFFQIMPLSNTLPPATRTNAFMIGDEDHERVLLDPSPASEAELTKLMNTLKKWKISKVLITHHHQDHHEFSVSVAQKLDTPMLMSQFTYEQLQKKHGVDYFMDRKIQIVKEGDVITHWLSHEVRVIEVPGHDKGQIALMPESKEWFIAGDLFQGVGTVVIGGFGSSMQEYMRTLEKVIALNPQIVFPSHGIGLGGVGILAKTLEHRKWREQQIIECLKNKKTEEEMLGMLYAETPSSLKPYALANIRAHLRKIADEGLI
jgi:endoribonuclease LACTB2